MFRQLVIVAAALFAICLADDDVVVGTKDNFENLISKDELTFVKFYAPWCGHCKKMAPDFQKAATELKGKAVLVDLDATEAKELATKYEVRGFPTLKLFSKGEVIADYSGGRSTEDMVKYIERALLPSFTKLEDEKAVKTFVEENSGKVMVFGSSLDKFAFEFKKVSIAIHDILPDTIAFGTVEDASLLKSITKDTEISKDQVVIARSDGSVDVYTGEVDGLQKWIKAGALPSFQELSRENAVLYTEAGKPIFILFQDPKKKNEKIVDNIQKIADKYRGTDAPLFCWVNAVELKSFVDHIGLGDADPAIAIYDFSNDAKFIFNEEYSDEALASWVEKFTKGEIAQHMKSEPVPEKNDEPVYVVVADSWKDVVENKDKDVLIEQYAPWCGHCKALAPVLDELATELKDAENIVIAKMDATKNDAPAAYKASGYPTLHFFAAGSDKGVPYEGGRTKEDFLKFLRENATNKDSIPTEGDNKEEL